MLALLRFFLVLSVALVLGTSSCAGLAKAPSGPLPPVWAVGPDRLLELDPTVKTRLNTLPMYGGIPRSEMPAIQRAADEKLIADSSAAYGGAEAASAVFARAGFEFYDMDDYEKAMMRFNQAWLLDETNPDVFYGYAAVYQDHMNYVEAGGFAKSSIDLGQRDPLRVAECAFLMAAQYTSKNAAKHKGQASGVLPPEKEVNRIQSELASLNDRALGEASPADLTRVQFMAFKTQMLVLDYDRAWRSFDALEAMGEPVPSSYAKALEGKPRPVE